MAYPTPAFRFFRDYFVRSANEPQSHKPEAVVRAYRDFLEKFGNNFMAPPARGGAKENRVTPKDAAQHKRTQHLSEVRCLCCTLHSVSR